MTEWIIGNKVPRIAGESFQVQTKLNDVRTVEFRPDTDCFSLWFTDCTHPAQNALCNDECIKAWRVIPPLPSKLHTGATE